MHHKKAFTLAEVLITLVIIGIIAAITVPMLVTRYQKITVANKVKKMYSAFNQAIRLAETENGSIADWEYASGNELFNKYLLKYFNNVKYKENTMIMGYFHSGARIIFADGSLAICGKGTDALYFNTACLLFPSAEKEWASGATAVSSGYKYPTRQMFWFGIYTTGIKFRPLFMGNSRESNLEECKKPYVYNTGYRACAAVLMKDGWEFKDDYPWNIKQ